VALISPEFEPDVADILEEHFEVYSDNFLPDHVNRMCLADSRLFLPGLNLTYTDRASMAASTEVRVPFVDPVVFRAAFSLRGDHKISGRTGKVALKQAAQAWLPDEIINRPKASFSAPLRAWVTRDLRELIDDELVHGDLVSTGFIRPEALRALIEDDRSGRQDRSKQIWQLLTLELWYRNASKAGVGV
jgi:asparagine synthase (glutamine-hydrolysing)